MMLSHEAIAFVIIFIIIYYIVLPLRIGLKYRLYAHQFFRELPPEYSGIPAEIRGFFQETEAHLRPLGFLPSVHARLSLSMPNLIGYTALFANRETHTLSLATAVWAGYPRSPVRQKNYCVEFATDFLDRSGVNTSNIVRNQLRAVSPLCTKRAIPGMADLVELHRVHGALVARHVGTKKPLPPEEHYLAMMRDEIIRDAEEQVRQGYMALDPRLGCHRHTLKGALLGIWSLQWPMLSIRRRLTARRARALLAELGLPTEYRRTDYSHLAATYPDDGPDPLDAESTAALDESASSIATPPPPSHSAPAIASFVLGLLAFTSLSAAMTLLFIAAARDVVQPSDSPVDNTVPAACFLVSILSSGLGLLLGFFALSMSGRKKLFAVLGLCLCGLTGLILAGMIWMGSRL